MNQLIRMVLRIFMGRMMRRGIRRGMGGMGGMGGGARRTAPRQQRRKPDRPENRGAPPPGDNDGPGADRG